jgi:hypothetical protein
MIALGLAVVLAGVSTFATRTALGVCGAVAVALYGYELVNVTSVDMVDQGASAIEQSFAQAFSVDPGLGIYLGLFTGVALVGWGLVYPYVQKRKVVVAPTESPAPPSE